MRWTHLCVRDGLTTMGGGRHTLNVHRNTLSPAGSNVNLGHVLLHAVDVLVAVHLAGGCMRTCRRACIRKVRTVVYNPMNARAESVSSRLGLLRHMYIRRCHRRVNYTALPASIPCTIPQEDKDIDNLPRHDPQSKTAAHSPS